MLETPHVIVGAAIAAKIVHPALAIPLAFGSHFVLEKVPHWNPHLNTEKTKYGKVTKQSTTIIIFDVILSLVVGFYIAGSVSNDLARFVTIIAACFASVLPDVIEGPYFFLDFKHELMDKWIKFQKSLQVDAGPVPGLLTQVVTAMVALVWIFW